MCELREEVMPLSCFGRSAERELEPGETVHEMFLARSGAAIWRAGGEGVSFHLHGVRSVRGLHTVGGETVALRYSLALEFWFLFVA